MDFRTATTAMALLCALGLAMPAADAAGDKTQAQTGATTGGDSTTRDYTEQRAERDDPLVPDTDEDGFITREESAADWEQSFGAFDRDSDQGLTEQEWSFDEGPAFGDVDTDADQSVSQDEWMSYGEQSYEEALTEFGGDQLTTRDYNERRAWRDEGVTPSAQGQQ